MSRHANRLIKNALDIELIQNKLTKAFTVIAVVDGELHLRDRESKKTVTIVRENGKLLCQEDDSHNCNHVVACYSFPQTARLFKDTHKEMEELPLNEK